MLATASIEAASTRLTRELIAGDATTGIGLNAAHIFGPESEFDRIAATGVRYVRHGTGWQDIEKSRGQYDFSRHEGFYKAMERRGIGVIFILAYNNPLYEYHGRREILTDEGRAAYTAYAAAFVAHFKGRDVIWEIWNEPNTRVFWGSPPNSSRIADDYARLVKVAVPAMRAADPGAVILAGSVSNLWTKSYEWMEYAFSSGILEADFDGWSVHPYGLKRPEDYIAAYDHVRDLMRRHAGDRRLPVLVNSERGFPIGDKEGFVGGAPEHQETYKAAHAVRQYLVDQLCGVPLTVWYQWEGEGFGWVDGEKELPACRAVRNLTSLLRGYRFEAREPLESDLDFILRFVSAAGDRILVAWTAQPPDASPDAVRLHDVTLAVDTDEPVEVIDLFGAVTRSVPSGRRLIVTLDGNSQYIRVPTTSATRPSSPW